MGDSDWDEKDIRGVSIKAVLERVESWNPSPCNPSEGWKESNVDIEVPLGICPASIPEDERFPRTTTFSVPHVHHRSIVNIVRNVLMNNPNAKEFYLHPFHEYAVLPDGRRVRLYDEVVSGDHFIQLYKDIVNLPPVDGCELERVLLGMDLWSNTSHFNQFGQQKLWPVYMCFSNQPKWQRVNPNMGAWYDIAYMPEVRFRLLLVPQPLIY